MHITESQDAAAQPIDMSVPNTYVIPVHLVMPPNNDANAMTVPPPNVHVPPPMNANPSENVYDVPPPPPPPTIPVFMNGEQVHMNGLEMNVWGDAKVLDLFSQDVRPVPELLARNPRHQHHYRASAPYVHRRYVKGQNHAFITTMKMTPQECDCGDTTYKLNCKMRNLPVL